METDKADHSCGLQWPELCCLSVQPGMAADSELQSGQELSDDRGKGGWI